MCYLTIKVSYLIIWVINSLCYMYEDGNVLPTSVSNKQSTHAYMLTLGIPVIHF